jgi:hypothetical protein
MIEHIRPLPGGSRASSQAQQAGTTRLVFIPCHAGPRSGRQEAGTPCWPAVTVSITGVRESVTSDLPAKWTSHRADGFILTSSTNAHVNVMLVSVSTKQDMMSRHRS